MREQTKSKIGFVTKSDLNKLYHTQDLTMGEIAKHFNLQKLTVCKLFKKYKIKRKTLKEISDKLCPKENLNSTKKLFHLTAYEDQLY